MDSPQKLMSDTLKVLSRAEKSLLTIARRAERLEAWRETTKAAYLTVAHAFAEARSKIALYK